MKAEWEYLITYHTFSSYLGEMFILIIIGINTNPNEVNQPINKYGFNECFMNMEWKRNESGMNVEWKLNKYGINYIINYLISNAVYAKPKEMEVIY